VIDEEKKKSNVNLETIEKLKNAHIKKVHKLNHAIEQKTAEPISFDELPEIKADLCKLKNVGESFNDILEESAKAHVAHKRNVDRNVLRVSSGDESDLPLHLILKKRTQIVSEGANGASAEEDATSTDTESTNQLSSQANISIEESQHQISDQQEQINNCSSLSPEIVEQIQGSEHQTESEVKKDIPPEQLEQNPPIGSSTQNLETPDEKTETKASDVTDL